MPLYLYKCPQCEREDYTAHEMDFPHGVKCKCGSWMTKKPQVPRVNWNGRKPSDGGVTDYVRQLEADAPRLRDEMAAGKGT